MTNSDSDSSRSISVIEPYQCIVEDFDILAFESEEQLDYYTIWHEALVDKKKLIRAESERERQQIRQEIARKTSRPIAESSEDDEDESSDDDEENHPGEEELVQEQPSRVSTAAGQAAQLNGSIPPPALPAQVALPSGYTIVNSPWVDKTASQTSKPTIMKYKLTKLYNKLLGRQRRRNFVFEKQRAAKIDSLNSKCYLNSWLTYTALQALKLPDSNIQHLSATTTSHSKILAPMPQQTSILATNPTTLMPPPPPTAGAFNLTNGKKKPASQSKMGHQQPQPLRFSIPPANYPNLVQNPTMHLVYIDPSNIITYSNRINPQQIIEYKKKPPIQPSSSSSKKSSAASYDVYEIMEVLANSNKTHVTITRNINRPNVTSAMGSIYSHSVNQNTPGIVSTQLHLQARSYVDLMNKFYTEEAERLEQERLELENAPSIEETIEKYIKT